MGLFDGLFDNEYDNYSYSDTYGDGGPDANGNWDTGWSDSDTTNYNSSDWGWLTGVNDFYQRNKGWIDPAVGFGAEYYKADKAKDAADAYRRRLQPSIDFANKASARQQAYLDPAAVEAGVQVDLARKADMLSSRYRGEDMPTYASSLNKGMFGSNTFGKQMALTDAVRDTNWANVVVPGAYDQYYKRGTQMSNADTATASMLSGNPMLQPLYAQSEYESDPWGNAIINYFDRG